MKRTLIAVLAAATLIVPAAASGQAPPQEADEALPDDLFTVEDDVASVVVVSDGTTTTVVWASHEDIIEETALYVGELSPVELTAATNMVASATSAKCRLSVYSPRVTNLTVWGRSTQRCWGSLVDTHESWYELQQRSGKWIVVDDDEDTARAGRTIRLSGDGDCANLRSSKYRSFGLGLMRLTNGDVVDVGPTHSLTKTIGCSTV